MRWTRVVAVIAVLLVAVVVALLIVLNTIDWSRYQAPVVERVEAATGRRLAVDGTLRVHIGLRPGVVVEGVRFQNASWASQPEMVKVGRFQVQIALWPLLFGRVEVARIVLSDCDIDLETDAKGRGNWVFTPREAAPPPAPGKPPAPPPPGTPESKGGEPSAPAETLALIREVVIERSRLVYSDGVTRARRELEIERLAASMEDAQAPLGLDLAVRYDGEPVTARATVGRVAGLLAGGPIDLDLHAEAGGATLALAGPIRKPLEGRDFNLAVDVEGRSLASLSALAGSALPALGPYRLAAKLSDGEQRYNVEDLDLKIGESSLHGRVSALLSGARPRIEADLDSPLLRLEDLGAGGGSETAGPAASSGTQAAAPAPTAPAAGGDGGRVLSDEPLPLDALSSADAKVSLRVARLVRDTLELRELRTTVALDDRRLVIDPLRTELVGGALDGTVGLDGRAVPPRLDLRLDLDQLDSAKLLAALGVTEALKGARVDGSVVLGGRGRSPRALAASLDGEISLEVGSGKIDRAWAEAQLGGWAPLIVGSGDKKDIPSLNCAISRFGVETGVARAQGLAVDLPRLAVLGEGKVDLRSEKLDLDLEPVVKDARAGLVTPPAKLGGTFANPKFALDEKALGEKAVGIAAALLKGKSVVGGANLETSPGLEGCEELIAKQGKLTGQSESKAATQEVKKKLKKEVKKSQKKLGEKGADALGDALQDLLKH